MTRRRAEVALWTLAAVVLLWGYKRWREAVPVSPLAAAPVIAPVLPPENTSFPRRLRIADAAAAKNPFRLDRSPSLVQASGLPPGEQFPPPPLRPSLTVSGMVGPPWAAVLEGIPGREDGVVVRGGERFGDLRVHSVSRAAVVVSAPDTTWRLTVRRTWQ